MSEELEAMRESARQVLAELGLAAPESRSWPLVLELGWLLVGVPEELGGLGQGAAGACAFHAELGRHLGSAPYAAAALALDAICASALPEREAWVRRLTSERYVAAALGASSLRLRDGARLQGRLSAVPSADRASHLLVWTEERDCVALVALDAPGVSCIARPTWDETRRLFDVQLDDVALDASLRLAEGVAAQALVRRLTTQRDLALAADAVGGATALLQLTVEYLGTRRQFGRPLALFQALKHRCADLKVAVTAADALLLDVLDRAATAMDTDAGVQAARSARHLACTTYAQMAEEALQLHGGIGMTAEHACHLFLKRAMLDAQLGDGSAEQAIATAFLHGLAEERKAS